MPARTEGQQTIRLTNLVLTLPLFDSVCISMIFEVLLFEWLVGSKNTSASIPPFFDPRNRLLRAAPVLVGEGRKYCGMDREGSINHDPLILSFARLRWIKLEGWMLGIVGRRSVPRVDILVDDIVDEVSVLSRYEGGGLCWSEFRKAKATSKKIKHTEGTGIRDVTSLAPFSVSELEEELFMMIIVKCKLECECNWQDAFERTSSGALIY